MELDMFFFDSESEFSNTPIEFRSEINSAIPNSPVSPSFIEFVANERNVNNCAFSPKEDNKFITNKYQHIPLKTLENCSLSQLHRICSIYNIKASGDRYDLIEKITTENLNKIRSI